MSQDRGASVIRVIESHKSLAAFNKRLQEVYAKEREKLGLTDQFMLKLSFKEGEKDREAQYLVDRAYGGEAWRGHPDVAMQSALQMLMGIKSPVSFVASNNANDELVQLSQLERLLIGTADPSKQTPEDLQAFLKDIFDAKEAGTNPLRPIFLHPFSLEHHIAQTQKYLHPNTETLRERVSRVISRRPKSRVAVARELAASVRSLQEQVQQLLIASRQVKIALEESINEMTDLKDGEKILLSRAVETLDQSTKLSAKRVKEELKNAQDAIFESGAPSKSSFYSELLEFQ